MFFIIVNLQGAGAFSRDFTVNLSLQCRAFSRALKTEKLKAPLFPGPIGAGTTNDWCIITSIYEWVFPVQPWVLIDNACLPRGQVPKICGCIMKLCHYNIKFFKTFFAGLNYMKVISFLWSVCHWTSDSSHQISATRWKRYQNTMQGLAEKSIIYLDFDPHPRQRSAVF